MLYQRWGSFSQACGASILNNRSVLSAAHCFFGDGVSAWRLRVGSTNANSGGTVHIISAIIMHPSYNDNILDNDVAIARSSTAFGFNNNVRPVSIAGANYALPDNTAVWAIGWGMVTGNGPSSEQLRQVQVWTINWTVCRNRYNELGWLVTNTMLCTGVLDVGGRDQCGGDSGGPLLHNNVVVGICSWGHPNCGHPRYPGVNALVSRFTSWIQSNA
ncbi:unnamed protein product [Leptidea sinapis]|uniref:Peptidase S1 domain-containing protein n=2 Tax=Leptidea sinapis TaxID=189913 RepID=A0A5E4QAB5_9NEOP|nr:unnamed protein product [Leptidea sinapis]